MGPESFLSIGWCVKIIYLRTCKEQNLNLIMKIIIISDYYGMVDNSMLFSNYFLVFNSNSSFSSQRSSIYSITFQQSNKKEQ